MEPLVSVICVSRNHERFCIEALDSVLNQTYKNIEWIILDAASTDTTPCIIDDWLKENQVDAIFLKEKELKPITVNLNKALTFAQGEFVQFLSLDDVLVKSKIELQLKKFESLGDNYVATYSDMKIIDENGYILDESYIRKRIDVNNISDNVYFELLKHNFLPATGLFFKIEYIRKIDCFDERLFYEDYDMNLRLARIGLFLYIDIPLVLYRKHNNNLTICWQQRNLDVVWSDALMFYKQLNLKGFSKNERNILKQNFIKQYSTLVRRKDNRSNYFFVWIILNLRPRHKLVALIIKIFKFRYYSLNSYCKNTLHS